MYRYTTLILNLKPDQHEYKVMGMAAYGTPKYKDDIYNDVVVQAPFKLKQNIVINECFMLPLYTKEISKHVCTFLKGSKFTNICLYHI